MDAFLSVVRDLVLEVRALFLGVRFLVRVFDGSFLLGGGALLLWVSAFLSGVRALLLGFRTLFSGVGALLLGVRGLLLYGDGVLC